MSRELKFRAFETIHHTHGGLTERFNYYDMDKHDDHEAYMVCCAGEGPIEQFTGLTDKNGVDIYEGDIINWDQGSTEMICTIQWIESEARFACISNGNEGGWMGAFHEDIEVINNIHEVKS